MFKKINLLIYQIERRMAFVAVSCMTLLVSLDVLQRLLARWVSFHIPGAQKFALGFMIWAAFLGASLATYHGEHIVLSALQKHINPALQKFFGFLSGVATGVFCLFLAYLAWFQFNMEFQDWLLGHSKLLVDVVPVPAWVVTISLPLTLGMAGFRFIASGLAHYQPAPTLEAACSH